MDPNINDDFQVVEVKEGQPPIPAEVKPLHKTKTFWAALTGLATLSGALVMGEVTLAEYIPSAVAFVVAMTFRQKLPKAIEVDKK